MRVIGGPEQHARLGALKQWMGRHGVETKIRIENKADIGVAVANLSRTPDIDGHLIAIGVHGRTL